MDSKIETPRIIAAIIEELETSNAAVFFRTDNDVSFVGSIQTLGENRLVVQATPSVTSEQLSCECIFYDRRLSFELSRSGDGSTYTYPQAIRAKDLRSSSRVSFAHQRLNAEVRWAGGISLGRATDISRSHISVTLPTPLPSACPGPFLVTVKSRSDSPDLYIAECALFSDQSSHESSRYVFSVTPNKTDQPKRAQRLPAVGRVIKFTSHRDSGANLSGEIRLVNVSLTGFFGEIFPKELARLIPMGLVLESQDPQISFFAVRAEGDHRIGFKINTFVDEPFSKSWIAFVYPQFAAESVPSIELSRLLVESRFLKGERRRLYEPKLEANLQAEPDYPEVLGLIRRFYQFNADHRATHHVSVARIHDNGWYIQELAGGSDRSTPAADLISDMLLQLQSESLHWLHTPRFLFGLFDPSSKANQSLWCERSRNQSFRAYRIHKSFLTSTGERPESQLHLIPLEKTRISQKRVLYECIPERILDATGLMQFGAISPMVNSRLNKLGRHYSSQLFGIQDTENTFVGFVHRYSAPFTFNVTGVLNAVQIFTSARLLKGRPVLTTVAQLLDSNPELVLGTSDILIVDMDEDIELGSVPHQTFRYMILDLNEVKS